VSETLLGLNRGNQMIYLYSKSDLTFVVRVQNYVKWAEFRPTIS